MSALHMRRPTRLPTLKRPLWWRIARVFALAYLRWCDRCIFDELRGYQMIAAARGAPPRITTSPPFARA